MSIVDVAGGFLVGFYPTLLVLLGLAGGYMVLAMAIRVVQRKLEDMGYSLSGGAASGVSCVVEGA